MTTYETQNDATNDTGIDIEALLGAGVAGPGIEYKKTFSNEVDRQLAREMAQLTGHTTLILIGRLEEPSCLPADCEGLCPSFRLISMRKTDGNHIAMFSVLVEREMAELFEEIDGRHGLKATAYDSHGRTKEAYVL